MLEGPLAPLRVVLQRSVADWLIVLATWLVIVCATTLLAIGRVLSEPGPPEEVMGRVAREVGRDFGADMVSEIAIDRSPNGLRQDRQLPGSRHDRLELDGRVHGLEAGSRAVGRHPLP